MTFGSNTVKYYSEYTGEDGATYQWQIRERGYDSATNGSTPLTPSTLEHAYTTWKTEGEDEYGPVVGSETKVSFFDDSGGNVLSDITTLGSGDFGFHKDYALAITRAGVLVWIGYMEPPDIGVSEDGPTEITLVATDGIGRLKNYGYENPGDAGEPHEGRARLTTIISEILSDIEFGSGFYTACEFYPRTGGTQLTANDDPLYNIYLDRLGLAVPDSGGQTYSITNKLDALKIVLQRFGLRICYAAGYWHIYNPHLYHGSSSFNRWEYNSAGAQQGGGLPSSFTHRVTPTDESIERTPGVLGQMQQYNGVTIAHEHEVAQVLLQPDFTPQNQGGGFPRRWNTGGRRDALAWASADTNNAYLAPGTGEDDYSGRVNRKDTGGSTFPANGSALTTLIGNYNWSQTSKTTYKTGDSFDATWQFKILPEASSGGSNRDPSFQVALQVKLNSGTPQYLEFDDDTLETASWTTSEKWLVYPEDVVSSQISAVLTQKLVTDTLPADGTITVTLGPVIEAATRNDSGGANVPATSAVLWDNIQLFAVVGAGEYRGQRTVTTNFVDGRDETRIKVVNTVIGDGPNNDSRGSLTLSDDISDRTSDWELGAITGAASGDSIDDLLSRQLLRSMNLPRPTHQASYETIGDILYPHKSIERSSNSYPALSLTLDWRDQSADGVWYKTSEQGFTDDLVTGIDSGPGTSVFSQRGYSGIGSSILTRLTKSFFSEEGKRITRTTAGIPAGTGTASITVEAITEPLLNDGDQIVIIAPDLNFYKVQVSADQAAGATSISIEDPDSPGSNFDFPKQVLSGANVFFLEEELLSVARLGEQGFAVTVLGQNVGTINATVSGAQTSLAVTDWIATVASGQTVELEQSDGSYVSVTLSSTAYKGATSISFGSTSIDVTSGDAVKASGTVSRADFTVTSDAISALLTNPGDKIATLDTGATFVSGKTNLDVGTSLTDDLKAGDKILVYTAGGTVYKVTVDSDVSAAASPIILTAADGDLSSTFQANDVVVVTSVSGLRIDLDGVQIVNTHLKNDGTNPWNGVVNGSGEITTPGTQGWIITRTGEAEFNDVTVRGSINAGGVLIGLDVGDVFASGSAVAGEHGVWINSDNYWILDTNAAPDKTHFRVGDSTAYMEWDETTPALKVVSGGNTVFDSSTATSGIGLDGTIDLNATGIIQTAGYPGGVYLDKDKIEFTQGTVTVSLGVAPNFIQMDNTAFSQQVRIYPGYARFDLGTQGAANAINILGGDIYGDNGDNISLLGKAAGDLTVGVTAGTLKLQVASGAVLSMPQTDGTTNQVLKTDGSGNLDWTTLAAGVTAIDDLSDVTITTPTTGDLLRYNGSAWVNYADSNYAAASHNHAASAITSGTFADARIAQSNVTQHQAALSITESQISDLGSYSVVGHTHAASDIASGTLAHERGGLEADVSAYNGLVKISGGATSAVTDNSTNWNTAYTHSQVTSGNPHSVTKSDVGLANVENTALSTWAGSLNITTVGTISFGTWQGTAISSTYIGSHTHAATDITSGTLASARLSGSYTGITGVGALSTGSISTGFGTISTANTISTTSTIYVGASSTFETDGIQLDYNGGNPRFYVGDGSTKYFKFDGTTGTLNGGVITNIASGSEIAIQGWQSDLAFSSTDADTVAWGSGTITLLDGTSYSIVAGNTGNMAAKTYVYLDIATSTTVLQTTTTATTAVGSGKILVAVAQNTASADEASFQVFGGSGGIMVTADSIAANSITANEIAANTITASQIASNTITANEISAGTITATELNVTSLDAITANMGSLTIDNTLQTSGYSQGGGTGVQITTSGMEVSASAGTYTSIDAGQISVITSGGSTTINSLSVTSGVIAANDYVLTDALRLDDVAFPGGTANVGTLFADASEVLRYYKGTAGPYTIWHSGNDGTGSGLDADTLDGSHASAFQTADSDLTTIAGLAKTNGNFIVGNGSAWVAESGATARASLGLTIGTHVQAYDAFLNDVATDLAAASATNKMLVHAPSVGSPSSATDWEYRDAVYMTDNIYSTYDGPVFVGASLEALGDTPATPVGTTFLGWMPVNVGGTAGRVAVYNTT